jgi:ParB family chromosome partitioning protein
MPVVIVRDQTPEQAYIDALIENVVREDLNPIERAEALTQIRVHLGARSWDEVARSGLIGLSRRQIFHLLGLTALPESVQEDIRNGTLTEKHGRALRTLHNFPDRLEQLRGDIKRRSLSGDEALSVAKELRAGAAAAKPQMFKVTYRTTAELIAALQAKLDELQRDPPVDHNDIEMGKVDITY